MKTATMEGIQDIFDEGMIGTLEYSFTTNSSNILDIPALLTPIANTKFQTVPKISWSAVTNVSTYEVDISTNTDFSVDIWDTVINDQTTSVTPGVTLVDGTYFCRVRYSIGTDYSAWSAPTAFYIEELVDEDVIIPDYLEILSVSPKNNSYNLPITTTFTLTFDEDVTKATVTLVDMPMTESTVTPTITDNTITIAPTLETNKVYEMVIHVEGTTKNLLEDYIYDCKAIRCPSQR
jgi:hypothetical protein